MSDKPRAENVPLEEEDAVVIDHYDTTPPPHHEEAGLVHVYEDF